MKSIKLTTPIGKAIYPKFQPDYFFDKKGVYSCKLHVSKEDFLNLFRSKWMHMWKKPTKLNLKNKAKR